MPFPDPQTLGSQWGAKQEGAGGLASKWPLFLLKIVLTVSATPGEDGEVGPGLRVPEHWLSPMLHSVSAFPGPCCLGQALGSQGWIFSMVVSGSKKVANVSYFFFLRKIAII